MPLRATTQLSSPEVLVVRCIDFLSSCGMVLFQVLSSEVLFLSRTKTHITVLSHQRSLVMGTRSFSCGREQHVSRLASTAEATFPEPGAAKFTKSV